ncbi:helix-turn-helix transcriptional regulator [Pandoraea anhela]|uniref:Transcriptional activator protein LasR n=1 Tax=Pandoraea anhela TaxID=2508295 RepID=A0A5E4XJ26_9BURK|nr:autoinducer binding domain-containing protein [Pandoraea anhela]VVE36160.1 Transcriptional activator protein LasR [Pandoraea anhela]
MRATRRFPLRSFADGLSALSCATEFDTLRALLLSLCGALRQRYFCYRGQFPLPDGTVATPRLDNLPQAWQARYDAQGFEAIDPTLALAARQLTPVEWKAGLYTSPDTRRLLEEQRRAGLRFGVTYPVYTPSGASGTLSLSSPWRPPSPCLSRTRHPHDTAHACAHTWMQHAGGVLATHVHEAVWRIVQRDAARRRAPVLTPRERECLRWVARGKTSWEIGRILTISEHGVVFHLRSVMRKFDVSSRHRAAKLASDYGLLDDVTLLAPSPSTCVPPDRQASYSVST